jgi:cytochrome c5
MSPNDPDTIQEVEHTGPIKTPKQLLAAVFFSFIVPVFVIIGLVYYVVSAAVPAAGASNAAKDVAARIQKVGMVEIRDANRPLKSGEAVFKGQCVACHGAGVAGAPKLGDTAAWAARLQTGYEALLNSALKGKGAMGPQGGGEHNDTEIGRAVVYLANAAGGKFAEPQAPAAASAGASAPAPAAAAGPSPDVIAALAAASKGAPTAVAAAGGNGGAGEALYKQACVACHASGVAGSPKFGDKAAWAPRLALGIDGLTASVIKGKGAMPPKGGSAAPDADIRAAVEFMTAAVK